MFINRVLYMLGALVILVSFSLTPVMATPSVIDCTENPGLEGCKEAGTGSTESPVNQNSHSNEISTANGSMAWNLVQLLFSLALVLGLIYGLLKFFNRRNKLFQKTRKLENIGGLSLGPSRSLQVVRIGSRVLVIGVGDNVEMITEITDEHTKEELLNSEPDTSMEQQIFTRFFQKKKEKHAAYDNSSSSVQFQQLFQQELGDLKDKRNQLLHNKKQGERHNDE
ncbi:flagellar biosynthetic protein FliZ [Thalassobacillus devorans]|uniref:Flagellar biosynthetic protein FliZ n=1 Tax=Thalassobacillus devorans TaxID=279813 RepID=A0ABQ1P385_9BACI|nr:flagellar biosynthetic protein FliO [Thalassobacillus devorans]NIK27925.1 flagellar protein FliO/FliZ [Thalassobacillus devorans]GGC90279.1 flagellar biosynthetic protein FliZ [Thalassobacillus devorans]